MEQYNENFKCAICTDEYSEFHTGRIPRILRCGHIICHNCACKIMEEGTIKCPFCNIVCSVPESDVRRLPKNVKLLDDIDEHKKTVRLRQAELIREREEAEAEAARNRLLETEKETGTTDEREEEESENSDQLVELTMDSPTNTADVQYSEEAENAENVEIAETAESASMLSNSRETEIEDRAVNELIVSYAQLPNVYEESMMNQDDDIQSDEEQEEENSEHDEDRKLDIPCDQNPAHIAVLCCIKCEINLCKKCSDKIHAAKAFARHQTFRLSEKPEPLIYCPNHPHNVAELICKQTNCAALDELMCITCQLYENHKGHHHDVIDRLCREVRSDVELCIEKIAGNRSICERHLKNYEGCLATYVGEAVEREKSKIVELYDQAKLTALRELDEFVEERTGKLGEEMEGYEKYMDNFAHMTVELSKILRMKKINLIENHAKVEQYFSSADVKIKEPVDLKPYSSYTCQIPSLQTLSIKMIDNVAIYFDEVNQNGKQFIKSALKQACGCTSSPDESVFGNSYLYQNRHNILLLNEHPADGVEVPNSTICAVLRLTLSEYDDSLFERLQFCMKTECLNKIIVAVYKDTPEWVKETIQEAMSIDARIEVCEYTDVLTIIDHIVQ